MLAPTYEITKASIISIALSRCMNQCNIAPVIAKLRDICTISPVDEDTKYKDNIIYVSGKVFPLVINTYAEHLEYGKTANYTIIMNNHNDLLFQYIIYYLKVASMYITTSNMLVNIIIPIFPSNDLCDEIESLKITNDNLQYMIMHMLL